MKTLWKSLKRYIDVGDLRKKRNVGKKKDGKKEDEV